MVIITSVILIHDQDMHHYYTVSQKNNTNVAYYKFNAHQLILVTFGLDDAEGVGCQIMICYPTSSN